MYNVEGKCNVWKSVGWGPDLPYNETEIEDKKKGVRYAVEARGRSSHSATAGEVLGAVDRPGLGGVKFFKP